MMIETDNWIQDIIKTIPEGIKKPKYYEPIAWHKYVKVEDLIQTIEDLSYEVERLSAEKVAPVVLDKQFLNLVEEIEDTMDTKYLEEDGTTDMDSLYEMVKDLYKAYNDKEEELQNTIEEREEYYTPRKGVNIYL